MIYYAEVLNGVVRHIGHGPVLPVFFGDLLAVDVTDVSPRPSEGDLYDSNAGVFLSAPPVAVDPVALNPLAFLRRFTAPERVAIRASANPYVVDFMDLLNKATEVLQSDPDVQGGMAYLVSLGLLSQARADEILAW